MPQKGYKLTKAQKKNLRITEQNFNDIKQFGPKNILERTFLGVAIDSWARRRAIQLLEFKDILWDENRYYKKEKYNKPKRRTNETQSEYNQRVKRQIERDLKEGEIIEIKINNKKTYVRIYSGYFSNETKSNLLDIQLEYKQGYVFRKNKDKNKALDLSSLNRMWERCLNRTNKRIEELNLPESRKIVHTGDHSKKIRLHDIRIAQGKNYLEKNPGDYQTVQEMLGHKNIQTTLDIYAQQSPDTTSNKIKSFYGE